MSHLIRAILVTAVLATTVWSTTVASAATPAEKCQAGKNKVAGKYEACRHGAEAKLATTGDGAAYATAIGKCSTKYTAGWQKLELNAGGACPSNGDAAPVASVIAGCTSNIATAVGGGALVDYPSDLATCSADLASCEAAMHCGNGTVESGESCDGADLDGKSCATFGSSDSPGLACTSTCSWDLTGCAYGAVIPARFIANGDQTATDLWTGRIWEMKTGVPSPFVLCPDLATCPDPHNVNNDYKWTAAGTVFDGTVKTLFLDVLNDVAGGGANCFAGHCDWRLPSALELKGLLLEPESVMTCSTTPCIDASFPGPTGTGGYWSASTASDTPTAAYYVRFDGGGLFPTLKPNNRYVRAVRAGS